MKRITDKPYMTYNTIKSEVNVKCPRCQGFGIVTSDRNSSYFRCTKCYHRIVKEHREYNYVVENLCKDCERYYRVKITDEKRQHCSSLYVECPYCGGKMQGKVIKKESGYAYYRGARNGKDPHFGFELWFLTSFQGKAVWAINREHLGYLIEYLEADLREKPYGTHIMNTQADLLPTFMKTAKNRERIVKILIDMQKTLG